MISDVLHEAVSEMDRYLNDPVFSDTYEGMMRKELLALRTQMDLMRQRLDTPPDRTTQRDITIMIRNGIVCVKA